MRAIHTSAQRQLAQCFAAAACALSALLLSGPALAQILDLSTAKEISEQALAERLKAADVVLLGELHDNPLHHAFRGRLIAQCGGEKNIRRVHVRCEALMREPRFLSYFNGWNGPWNFADAGSTARRLGSAGFVDVRTSLEHAPVRQPDAAAHVELIHGATAPWRR